MPEVLINFLKGNTNYPDYYPLDVLYGVSVVKGEEGVKSQVQLLQSWEDVTPEDVVQVTKNFLVYMDGSCPSPAYYNDINVSEVHGFEVRRVRNNELVFIIFLSEEERKVSRSQFEEVAQHFLQTAL